MLSLHLTAVYPFTAKIKIMPHRSTNTIYNLAVHQTKTWTLHTREYFDVRHPDLLLAVRLLGIGGRDDHGMVQTLGTGCQLSWNLVRSFFSPVLVARTGCYVALVTNVERFSLRCCRKHVCATRATVSWEPRWPQKMRRKVEVKRVTFSKGF